MIYFNLLCIAIIIVFIIDLSGFSETLKGWVSLWLTKGKFRVTDYELKPWTCSLCMTWWVGLIYLLFRGDLTVFNIMYVGLLAFLTDPLLNLLLFIKDILNKIINYVDERTIRNS